MLQPLGCRDYLRFDLFAASIRKSGLEIKNRCTVCPCFDILAASIRKFGLEIGNRCTDCPCFDLLSASILKSGLEIGNRCTDCPCFGLLVASIRKSGPEIGNRCTDCPFFDLFAASIRKSRLEIKNRCNTIVPASITARLPLCRRRKVELPACCFVVVAGDERPACRMTVAGAGRDRTPRRRHNPK